MVVNLLSVRAGNIVYVPASYIMYLSDFCRFLLCTCEWERGGRGGLEKGRGLEREG
jgi:hypothetical protein